MWPPLCYSSLTAEKYLLEHVEGELKLTNALPTPHHYTSLCITFNGLWPFHHFAGSVELYLQSCKLPPMSPNIDDTGLKTVITTSMQTPSQLVLHHQMRTCFTSRLKQKITLSACFPKEMFRLTYLQINMSASPFSKFWAYWPIITKFDIGLEA